MAPREEGGPTANVRQKKEMPLYSERMGQHEVAKGAVGGRT